MTCHVSHDSVHTALVNRGFFQQQTPQVKWRKELFAENQAIITRTEMDLSSNFEWNSRCARQRNYYISTVLVFEYFVAICWLLLCLFRAEERAGRPFFFLLYVRKAAVGCHCTDNLPLYPHSLFSPSIFCILVFLEKSRKDIICVYSSVRKESSTTES